MDKEEQKEIDNACNTYKECISPRIALAQMFHTMRVCIKLFLKDGRERSLALTKIDEAEHWVKAEK